MKKRYSIVLLATLLISLSLLTTSSGFTSGTLTDFDPLVDIAVTVEIQKIRLLAIKELQTFPKNYETPVPNFYVTVIINDEPFTSPVWNQTKYVTEPNWSATMDVPDDQEFVTITLQLWSDQTEDVLYDLGGDLETQDVTMQYSIKTGHWTGDDQREDTSGYGRLNGCDDGTIYEDDRDCELWFDIYQNDLDNDRIPYWIEVETLGTDPSVDDSILDYDNDSIPTYWEYRWGYDPLVWDDHKNIDPEGDSIDNVEEYLTAQWFSDPYRKDLFVEMDIMGDGPNGEKTYFPDYSEELIQTAFNKQNIVYHLDRGAMGGSDIIPFAADVDRQALEAIYNTYFLHGDPNYWRRGIFHYGVVVYNEYIAGYTYQSDAYQIASAKLEERATKPFLERDIVYASCYMHEMGHTLGFWPIPGHNRFSQYPWQIGWWISHSYRSCMNYGWTYLMVDYSDGSRRAPDLNDWERMDYSYFEGDWW